MKRSGDIARERHRALNPQTLAKLKANGSDLNRIHQFWNSLNVESRSLVAPLCLLLEEAGYVLDDRGEEHSYAGTAYWLVTARKAFAPTLAAIGEMTDECVAIATEVGAEYDGWYTEVVTSVS